jgi:hypothetical protein
MPDIEKIDESKPKIQPQTSDITKGNKAVDIIVPINTANPATPEKTSFNDHGDGFIDFSNKNG